MTLILYLKQKTIFFSVFCKRVRLKHADNKRNYIVNLSVITELVHTGGLSSCHMNSGDRLINFCRCWTIRWIHLKACWCKTLIKIQNLTLFSANVGLPKTHGTQAETCPIKLGNFLWVINTTWAMVFTAAEISLISTSTKPKLVSAHRLETTDDALNFMLETFACVHRKTSQQLILAVRQTTTFNPAHKRIRAGTQLTFSPLHCCNHQTTAEGWSFSRSSRLLFWKASEKHQIMKKPQKAKCIMQPAVPQFAWIILK